MIGFSLMFSKPLLGAYKASIQPYHVSNKIRPNQTSIGTTFTSQKLRLVHHSLPYSLGLSPVLVNKSLVNRGTHALPVGQSGISDLLSDLKFSGYETCIPTMVKLVELGFLSCKHYLTAVICVPLAIFMWTKLPMFFRNWHKYLLIKNSCLMFGVPWDTSFWCSLEVSVRYGATLFAIIELVGHFAPTLVQKKYIKASRKSVAIYSFLLLLNMVKNNILMHYALRSTDEYKRVNLRTLGVISSFTLFILGFLSIGEIFGVTLLQILTGGSIAGTLTVLFKKEFSADLVGWASVYFSNRFSVGHEIKTKSVNGRILKMGFTTFLLETSEKNIMTVPYSLVTNEATTNLGMQKWYMMEAKFCVKCEDPLILSSIVDEILEMMKRNNQHLYTGDGALPECYISMVTISTAKISLRGKLKFPPDDDINAEALFINEVTEILEKNKISVVAWGEF